MDQLDSDFYVEIFLKVYNITRDSIQLWLAFYRYAMIRPEDGIDFLYYGFCEVVRVVGIDSER